MQRTPEVASREGKVVWLLPGPLLPSQLVCLDSSAFSPEVGETWESESLLELESIIRQNCADLLCKQHSVRHEGCGEG